MSALDQQTQECFVCRKHRGDILVPGGAIYQDDVVLVSHIVPEQSAVYLGHLVVEPKRHLAGLADLTDAEAQHVGLAVTRLSRALMTVDQIEHVYAFVLGHHVPHLHVHVIPRYRGAPREYWGVRVDEWPDAPRGKAEEITAFSARLRDAL